MTAIALGLTATATNAAITSASGQFSSKLYTEGLGRIPDQPGWQGTVNFWNANTCNVANLRYLANNILTSSEFTSLSPSHHEKVFRLYRAALHRDATPTELTSQISAMTGGAAWLTIVTNVINSTEFNNRVTLNCGSGSLGWQNTPAANLVVTSTGNVTTESDLRSRLIAASAPSAPSKIVYLEQGATILLNSPLIIPPGVTLTTVGAPGQRKAPLLGRLVRNWLIPSANQETDFTNNRLVILQADSKLQSVWVDGRLNQFGYTWGAMNVFGDGSNVEVSNNLMTDSAGWTNMQYLPRSGSCQNGFVYSNMITAYGSSHLNQRWSDGISIGCMNVTVQENQIIDATDVGIVVYHAYPNIQTSKVFSNYVFNAGNSAYGGLVSDPLMSSNMPGVPVSTVLDFTGTQFYNNTVWSSPAVHLDAVISNGTRAWFGANDPFTGKGASFSNNTTGSNTVTAGVGIIVSGMTQAYVQGNNFSTLSAPSGYRPCGLRNVAIAPMPYANDSGSSIQLPNTVVPSSDPIVVGCMGH
ncbi:MAG: hypothetical protein ACXW3B_00545 [Telluria sp.]